MIDMQGFKVNKDPFSNWSLKINSVAYLHNTIVLHHTKKYIDEVLTFSEAMNLKLEHWEINSEIEIFVV